MEEIYAKSIEELDGNPWGEPPPDATGLVERVHRLRTVKVRDLSDDDISTLLGQREGADWLVPLALDRLAEDPLAGAFYPGHLLVGVLLNRQYFERFPNELLRLSSIRRELTKLRDDADKVLANPDWPSGI